MSGIFISPKFKDFSWFVLNKKYLISRESYHGEQVHFAQLHLGLHTPLQQHQLCFSC